MHEVADLLAELRDEDELFLLDERSNVQHEGLQREAPRRDARERDEADDFLVVGLGSGVS